MRPGRPLDPQAVGAATVRLAALLQPLARPLVVAAGDLSRLKIVRALDGAALSAGDLARVIGRSSAATSQHLAVLRRLEVVASAREGNVVRYRLAESPAARVLLGVARAFDALRG